jgi:hypothetical protein
MRDGTWDSTGYVGSDYQSRRCKGAVEDVLYYRPKDDVIVNDRTSNSMM